MTAANAISLERMDVGRILEQADGKARAAYFIDMAKAESREKLWEARAAEKLVRQHLVS